MLAASVSSSNIVVGVEEPIVPKPKKAKKVEWEFNRMFQNIWVANLPWVEVVMAKQQKTTIIKPSVKVGKYFMSLSIQHAKNERQFATMHVKGSIIDQVNVGLHIAYKRNFLQFVTISTFYNKDDHL